MNGQLRRSLSAAAVLLALSAVTAIGQTVDIKMKAGSGVGYNGVQVGPYRGMLVSEPGTPTIDIFCVDYLNEVHVNDQWTAKVTNLATGNLANTRLGQLWGMAGTSFYGSDDVLTRYRKAAWLTKQFAIQNTSAWGGIHAAIWLLTAPNPTTNLPYSTFLAAAGSWLTGAATNYMSINLSSFSVLTDTRTVNGVRGTQEYLVSTTPEPVTVLLLGTGLAGMYAARRRRSRVSLDS